MFNLALSNGLFVELEKDEVLAIEGGSLWKALVLTAGCVIIAIAPVTGIVAGIGASVVGTPVAGVAGGIAAGAAMASAGASMINDGLGLK